MVNKKVQVGNIFKLSYYLLEEKKEYYIQLRT